MNNFPKRKLTTRDSQQLTATVTKIPSFLHWRETSIQKRIQYKLFLTYTPLVTGVLSKRMCQTQNTTYTHIKPNIIVRVEYVQITHKPSDKDIHKPVKFYICSKSNFKLNSITDWLPMENNNVKRCSALHETIQRITPPLLCLAR